jgi:hypothetical protein
MKDCREIIDYPDKYRVDSEDIMAIIYSENLEPKIMRIRFHNNPKYNRIIDMKNKYENEIIEKYEYDITKTYPKKINLEKKDNNELLKILDILEIKIHIMDIGRKLANQKIKEELCKKILGI